MSKSHVVVWILAIVTLLILILGGVFFGVYHKSEKHHELSKVGLGLLITGGVLLIVTVVVAIVTRHKSKSGTLLTPPSTPSIDTPSSDDQSSA